ncbi:MAG: GxxExxY protein [Candidatus Nealsonbacteria bacterium CG10_big_fil_rev_8_21_14_0_10_36_23]|uniref:GxxExxY protein n=1 Tax=Candidatus Nealsonbacteria bacterium CG10_big_fil_rev_8_21_14_0_10_36_23 TaxID=1974709 RepID=A0A2H0TLP4_9BACT|nr:MAG: GxxExxY protein [Candidatus Nealsonbacteria bacterium CG10_big_fil_rev_8_21_14_0_10_36_23]
MKEEPTAKVIKTDLVYPELSYKIIGILFEVYNTLGHGYQEIYYQRAVSSALKKEKFNFKEQVSIPLKYLDKRIGNYFLDFLIEDKIVLEIKRGDRFSRKDIEQIYGYLRAKKLQLGLLVNFTNHGVKFKRILNINSYIRKNSPACHLPANVG